MFRLEDMKKYIILSLLCGCLSVNAQTMVPLTYRQYMERVAEGNLEYASEKLNVPAAKAEVTAAKVLTIRIFPCLISIMRIIPCKWEKVLK